MVVYDDFLIDIMSKSSSGNRVGPGPKFKDDVPPIFDSLYPLAEEVLSFESPQLDWSKFSSNLPNWLWHRPNSKYVEWLDRMIATKEVLWKRIGIYDAVMLSRSLIDMDKNLFLAPTRF